MNPELLLLLSHLYSIYWDVKHQVHVIIHHFNKKSNDQITFSHLHAHKYQKSRPVELYKPLLHSNIPSSLLNLSNDDWNILPFFIFSCSLGQENCSSSALFEMGSSWIAISNNFGATSEGLMVTGMLGMYCFLGFCRARGCVKRRELEVKDNFSPRLST